MRVWIDRGYLIQAQTLEHAGRDYVVPLEFQVFNADGSPSTGSYRGEASFDGRRLVLGDVSRPEAILSEDFIVERQATTESWDYYSGFKAALEDKREAVQGKFPKKMRVDDPRHGYYANSSRWWEGYRDAWREKREKTTKNQIVVHDASGVRARPRSLAAAHRATRRANMAGTRVSRYERLVVVYPYRRVGQRSDSYVVAVGDRPEDVVHRTNSRAAAIKWANRRSNSVAVSQ